MAEIVQKKKTKKIEGKEKGLKKRKERLKDPSAKKTKFD